MIWREALLLLLISLPTAILTAQGVSYLEKWGPGDLGTCTYVRVRIAAWRDTGYICNFTAGAYYDPTPGYFDDRCLAMGFGGKGVRATCGYGSSADGVAWAWTWAQIGASRVRDALDLVEVPPWWGECDADGPSLSSPFCSPRLRWGSL